MRLFSLKVFLMGITLGSSTSAEVFRFSDDIHRHSDLGIAYYNLLFNVALPLEQMDRASVEQLAVTANSISEFPLEFLEDWQSSVNAPALRSLVARQGDAVVNEVPRVALIVEALISTQNDLGNRFRKIRVFTDEFAEPGRGVLPSFQDKSDVYGFGTSEVLSYFDLFPLYLSNPSDARYGILTDGTSRALERFSRMLIYRILGVHRHEVYPNIETPYLDFKNDYPMGSENIVRFF